MSEQRDNLATARALLDGVMLSARDNYESWYGPSPDGPAWINGVQRPLTDADRAYMRACGERTSMPRLQAVNDQPASSTASPRAQVVELSGHRLQHGSKDVDLVLETRETGVGAVLRQVRHLVQLQLVHGQGLAALQRRLQLVRLPDVVRHQISPSVGVPGAEDTESLASTVGEPTDKAGALLRAGQLVGRRSRGWRLLRLRGRSSP